MQLKPMYGEETESQYKDPRIVSSDSIPFSPLFLWETDDEEASHFKKVDLENGRFQNCQVDLDTCKEEYQPEDSTICNSHINLPMNPESDQLDKLAEF